MVVGLEWLFFAMCPNMQKKLFLERKTKSFLPVTGNIMVIEA